MTTTTTVEWEKLDKTKFVINGVGIFSFVTAALFPLTVLKTRRMIVRDEGPLALWKGFSVVIVGTIPARMLYLSTLEFTKYNVRNLATDKFGMSPTSAVALSDFCAGASASCAAQAIIVPIDVVSQNMMIASKEKGGAPPMSGLETARRIIRAEGVRGLFRGVGISLVTFVPSSGLWWGAYGLYNRLLTLTAEEELGFNLSSPGAQFTLQTGAGVCAGATSGLLTTPLDVIKTRLQTAKHVEGEPPVRMRDVVSCLLREEGPRGLLRGAVPRMASVALWGTAMVNAYELLKRISV